MYVAFGSNFSWSATPWHSRLPLPRYFPAAHAGATWILILTWSGFLIQTAVLVSTRRDGQRHAAFQPLRLGSAQRLGPGGSLPVPRLVSSQNRPGIVSASLGAGPDRPGALRRSRTISPLHRRPGVGHDPRHLQPTGSRRRVGRLCCRYDVSHSIVPTQTQTPAGRRTRPAKLGMAGTHQQPRHRDFGPDGRRRFH